jgi:hypothetical protein
MTTEKLVKTLLSLVEDLEWQRDRDGVVNEQTAELQRYIDALHTTITILQND